MCVISAAFTKDLVVFFFPCLAGKAGSPISEQSPVSFTIRGDLLCEWLNQSVGAGGPISQDLLTNHSIAEPVRDHILGMQSSALRPLCRRTSSASRSSPVFLYVNEDKSGMVDRKSRTFVELSIMLQCKTRHATSVASPGPCQKLKWARDILQQNVQHLLWHLRELH